MKIRIGFVSNSSTSSFVVVGKKFKITNNIKKQILTSLGDVKIEDLDEDDIDNQFYDTFYHTDEVLIDGEVGEVYVGYVLGVIASDSLEDISIEETLSNIQKKAEKTLQKMGINFVEIKIYGGVMSS